MNNINDNSNNNINIEARTAYASALMNVFDRLVNNENTYINSDSIFSNNASFNSIPTPYIVPNQLFRPRNRNIRNLLFPAIANIEKENIAMMKTTNLNNGKYRNIEEMREKIHKAEKLILQTIEKNISY